MPREDERGCAEADVAPVFDKKEKNRVNARAMRAREKLKQYLLKHGYRMGGEF